MQLKITSGCGTAPTALGAFDRALLVAGIANFNLLYLSSVIPPGSCVVHLKPQQEQPGVWGDRLYVVMAQQRETEIGNEAWAGIGWVQDHETSKGLFVEHHGNSERFVVAQIQESLDSMTSSREGTWQDIKLVTAGITCESHPVCAIAAATYRSESW